MHMPPHPQKAMEVIGFLPDETSSILELLSAILNLGNATFKGYSLPNGTDACELENLTCKQYSCLEGQLHMRV